MIGFLIACYPARWRRRYGEEFAAILESRPLGPFDAFDVLLGAIDAHLHLRGPRTALIHERELAMSLRIGGLAAVAGGLLWLFVSAASAGRWSVAGPLADIILLAASVLLLVALAGLSAFQARRYPRLVWAAFTIPAGGAAIAILGQVVHTVIGDQPFVFGLGTWTVWMAGLLGMFVGSGLFAAVTWRLRTLSRAAAGTLLAGSLLIIPAMLGLAGLITLPGELLLLAAVMVFSSGWIGIGASALRAGRPLAAAPG